MHAELGLVGHAGLGRSAHQNASRRRNGVKHAGQRLDQDRHALVGVDDAADVHDDLVLGTDPGDRRRAAWCFVLSQVDAGINHADPLGGHPFLGDHDLL